jgi:hypothetical protein
MNKTIIENIKISYNKGKSAEEIGKDMGLSWRQIIYWMSKHGIKRRNRSEATYLKRNFTDPFYLKTSLNEEERLLKALALGLYLGEGSRRQKNSVRLSNSDPVIIRIFIYFLQIICGVLKRKIKLSLIIHPDIEKDEAEHFWSNYLKIPLSQFTKTTILKPRGNGTYNHRSLHGVATVYVHNLHLRNILQSWIKEYILKFAS